jgi:5-methylcytosine-specific restriction endonuclease McrA
MRHPVFVLVEEGPHQGEQRRITFQHCDLGANHCKECKRMGHRSRFQKNKRDPKFREQKKLYLREWRKRGRETPRDTKLSIPFPEFLKWALAQDTCFYCGTETQVRNFRHDLRKVDENNPQAVLLDLKYYSGIDHFIPLAKGGTNDLDNLRCSCSPCNKQKHSKIY